MFANLDAAALEAADFKEDSVREEIIAPILKRLGYRPTGSNRVVRSKTLKHPFIRIGTRQHGVLLVPDYTLFHDDKALLVLDAKRPCEDVLDDAHLQQAYSYAIHPEVRCRHFALCNGRRLVVFSIEQAQPLLDLEFADFVDRWEEVERCLGPRYLLTPALRNFQPDLGLRAARMGLDSRLDLLFEGARPTLFARLDDRVFSANGSMRFAEEICCASFDLPHRMLSSVLAPLAEPLAAQFRAALSRSPYQASTDLMLELDLTARLGREVTVQHETFIPFIVTEVRAARLNREPVAEPDDLPAYIFRLRRAFDELRRRA